MAEGGLALDQDPERILGLLGVGAHSCRPRPGVLDTGSDQLGARTEGDQALGARGNAGPQAGLHRGRDQVQGGDHVGQEEGARGRGQRADRTPHRSSQTGDNLNKTRLVGLKKGHLRLKKVTLVSFKLPKSLKTFFHFLHPCVLDDIGLLV